MYILLNSTKAVFYLGKRLLKEVMLGGFKWKNKF
jgi:hypothetical protein